MSQLYYLWIKSFGIRGPHSKVPLGAGQAFGRAINSLILVFVCIAFVPLHFPFQFYPFRLAVRRG